MTVVLVVVALVVLLAVEVRAAGRDRKFSATPVVIVKAPGLRWWRRLVRKAVNVVLVVVLGAAAIVVLPRLVKAVPSAPRPTGVPTSSRSHVPTPSRSATPGKEHTP